MRVLVKDIDKEKYCDINEFKQYIEQNTRNGLSISVIQIRKVLGRNVSIDSDNIIITGIKYYVKLDYLKECVELFNKSIELSTLIEYIRKINPNRNSFTLRRRIFEKLDPYQISLFSTIDYYIDQHEYDMVVRILEEMQDKKCILGAEVNRMIVAKYPGIDNTALARKYLNRVVEKCKLETITIKEKYDFLCDYGNTFYPQKTIDEVFKYLNENVEEYVCLVNMSEQEYLSLSVSDFENEYRELTKEDLNKLKFECKHELVLRGNKKYMKSKFKPTGIRLLQINIKPLYVNKKDLDNYLNIIQNYICASTYCRERGFRFLIDSVKLNNIDYITHQNKTYMTEENLSKYIKHVTYLKEFREQETLHDRVKMKMDYLNHSKDCKYPNVRKLILEFCKDKNRGISYTASIHTLYVKILDNIKVDLNPYNKDENKKLFLKILNDFMDNGKMTKVTVTFMNYLRGRKNEPFELIFASRNEECIEKEPYTSEEFINLLSSMLNVISDDSKLKKLYRDWKLSTSCSYILLHYCLAWRKSDLINNLPMVNLSLISNDISSGEDFIKWLECGNRLTYKQCKIICESLEEETYRLRKRASKTDMILQCIISDSLVKEVGTILCINEANRQIFENNNKDNRIKTDVGFMKTYTSGTKISEILNKKLDIDVNKILNGSFDNTRMNKGFLNLVKDKAEELNLFAYSYVQILRSHKSRENELSETTKIYLNKSIDKKSVLAFSTGTMGSVAYLLKELIDEQFDNKEIEQQIEDINNLPITNYQLEQSTNLISSKVQIIKKEMDEYFRGGIKKENFLKKLLYGQNYVGIEEKTKCLIKIIREGDNELTISPLNAESTSPNNKCPLKRRSCLGCDYMIALRYFIYEFEKKYNQVLTNLEKAKSSMDKEIFIMMINNIYVPLLEDIAMVVGYDEIYEIVDLNRLKKLEEYY